MTYFSVLSSFGGQEQWVEGCGFCPELKLGSYTLNYRLLWSPPPLWKVHYIPFSSFLFSLIWIALLSLFFLCLAICFCRKSWGEFKNFQALIMTGKKFNTMIYFVHSTSTMEYCLVYFPRNLISTKILLPKSNVVCLLARESFKDFHIVSSKDKSVLLQVFFRYCVPVVEWNCDVKSLILLKLKWELK